MGMKQEDYIYLLHKTSEESPEFIEDIFNNGLKSSYDYSIHSTLAEIKETDLQQFGLEQCIMNYLGDSEDYNSVVVVKIPKEYMLSAIHRGGKINPPVPFWKSNDDRTTSFTPHLIQGIYCKRVSKSFTNPNFSPVYDPTGLKYSDEQINNMWSYNLDNWITFANSRKNVDYGTLCQIDKQKQNWDRVIKYYSDMYGIQPTSAHYTMSDDDVELLNHRKKL